MQQYYLNKELEENVVIEDDKFHYLKNVIRIKKGENILLFNTFLKAQYEVEEINKKNIKVKKIKEIEFEKTNTNITLAVGLLKKDNIDLVVQKSVELGASKILLTKFMNNVVKFDNKEEKKIKRYNDIAISACEQSKRNSLCEVMYEDSINKINFESYDKTFLLYEQEKNTNSLIKEVLNCKKEDKILLIVGPEGGFDDKELAYFKYNKVKFCSLGKNILRAETAAIMSIGLTTNILNEKE